MKNWQPELPEGDSPIYVRLIDALNRDIRAGRLAPGDRLPPHRDLAHHLSLSVGTISRAYGEAERRGLLTSHVGRGSFVAGQGAPFSPDDQDAIADMAHNLPPLQPAEARIGEALAQVRKRTDLLDCMTYAPPEGEYLTRQAGAAWLNRRHALARANADDIIQCNGSQHALALIFAALARAGDSILCEAATYPGIRTLADHAGYRLEGVAMDERGILPEALDRAAQRSGARVLALIPTLQNPTAITLDAGRRAEIVAIARHHDLMIVEDDPYRIYADADCPPAFADLAPERTFLIAGLSKSIAPGLRLGFLLPPEGFADRERLILGIRALGYSPSALGGLIFSQWMEDGAADHIADALVKEMRARTDLAQALLGDAITRPGAAQSPHVWLPMPLLEAERLSARALRAGIAVTPPDAPVVHPSAPSGIRLCLGAIRSRDKLESALRDLVRLMETGNMQDRSHGLI